MRSHRLAMMMILTYILIGQKHRGKAREPFILQKNQENKIDKALKKLSLQANAKSIFHFCKNASQHVSSQNLSSPKTYLLHLK